MSGDDLRIKTAHLGNLAVKQARAAVDIRSATMLAEGAEAAVSSTHGNIASASASALTAVLAARRSAGSKMAAISDDLCDKLAQAAKRYDQADEAMSGTLRTQMQAGQT
jgi:hypothetical protein